MTRELEMSDDHSAENDAAIKRIIDELIYNEKPKVVTIWGAGASISSGIPGGNYILKRMKQDLSLLKYNDSFKKNWIISTQKSLKN
jgi:hypothetical protein